jgi:phosphatidylserine/phosphatidylglycerophosphate/cardiolipin synthase-like enzyme
VPPANGSGPQVRLVAFANSDDVLLRWTCDAVPDELEGFAIERRLKRGNEAQQTTWLDNYAPPGPKSYQTGDRFPSDQRPFRAFAWTDYDASRGDRVSYRIAPFLHGATAPKLTLATAWTTPIVVGRATEGAAYQPFFNRGFIISQFISRYLAETYPDLDRLKAIRQLKKDIDDQLDRRIRLFLSGQIRSELVSLLQAAVADKGTSVYAALFELEDEELVQQLVELGPRAHLVLANGSISVPKDKDGKPKWTTAQARTHDENKAARTRLLDAEVDVDPDNRFVAPGALAHNKFAVIEEAGAPRRVWTGSTNWTTSGLCTQLNNALLVEDDDVAQAYRAQWDLLRAAGSAHPRTLATGNATPTDIAAGASGVSASVHFTRERKYVDLTVLGDLVREATQGVLFLMFIPGAAGVLKDVLELAASQPKLLVRGVVSQLPKGRADEKTGTSTSVKVTVIGSGAPDGDGSVTYDVVQPEGRAQATAHWAAEITRQQFLANVGHAIIHSKVLVVDPFGEHPIVVTGSHNFSRSASSTNDENFIVVRDDRALAEAYAVNIDSAWRHYAYRVATPHTDLQGPAYLRALLGDQRREEAFWGL